MQVERSRILAIWTGLSQQWLEAIKKAANDVIVVRDPTHRELILYQVH